MNPRQQLGHDGEAIVVKHLIKEGFIILATNYNTRFGELDIVAQNGEVVAFIEVKTRKHAYFPISMTVNFSKQQKLLKAAKHFVMDNRIYDSVLRFDVATIEYKETSYHLEYIPNAFNPQGYV